MPVTAVDARMVNASGIGTYLQNLLPRLIESAPEGSFLLMGTHELQDFAWARSQAAPAIPLSSSIYTLREQIELSLRRPSDADLFWSPHYNLPLLVRCKRLVTIHDVLHLARPEFVRGPHQRAYARMMFRSAGRADARIFDSRFTADEFRRRISSGSGFEMVVYPGVDESWFSVEPGDPPHPRPYLLYVGNVKPHKNLRGLLRAFGSVRDRIPHDLVIVGRREGFIHGDPRVITEAAPFADRVRFTGWQTLDQVQRFFAGAEALVFPSLYEGFGLPPLEAMAASCPVICSDAASLPEVCGDAPVYCDAGRTDSIADAILRVTGSESLRNEMRDRGRERARRFSWDRCARETWQVMERIAAAGNPQFTRLSS